MAALRCSTTGMPCTRTGAGASCRGRASGPREARGTSWPRRARRSRRPRAAATDDIAAGGGAARLMTTETSTERNSVTPRRPTHKQLVLAVCCVSQFMVILDLSIVNVALPNIQEGLRFSSADLQWVIDAYAIAFAGFLMLAGRAADLFGQRRTFALALFTFALASLIGGTAPTSGVLILARALQGFGGAGMAACSLAIITSTFAAGPERHRAIALWGAMNGAGGAAGVLFGGVITDLLSWRWVLLVNVPIGVAAAAVAAAVVAERRAGER